MRVWSHILSGRFYRKSSSFLENMAEEDKQSLHNKNNKNNRVRTLRNHMNTTRINAPLYIVFPPDTSHFNFKPDIIQLLPTFHGLDLENPYLHLREFEEVCNTYNDLNCSMNTDTTKRLMSSPKCRSVEVINNPARPGSNHREVNCINYK